MGEQRASDMSQYWRLVSLEGDRVTGTFWVSLPKPGKEAWVKAVDVIVWAEGRHWGRSLYSNDLTGSVTDGVPELAKHMVAERVLADVEEVWDEMLRALVLAVEAAGSKPEAAPDAVPSGEATDGTTPTKEA